MCIPSALSGRRSDTDVYQTAKYVRESYDNLVDIFECIGNFLSRLKIYTEIQPTLAITEITIKIMVELLGVLALATKQINQGRLSKSAAFIQIAIATSGLTSRRKFCQEITGRERNRISSSTARSTHPRGVEGDRRPDFQPRLWSGYQHGGCDGRCA